MDRCSVGTVLEGSCFEKSFRSQQDKIISIKDLTIEEQEILGVRVEAETKCEFSSETSLTSICAFHKNNFLDNYSHFHKTCSNIFQIHKKPIQNLTLCIISYNWYKQVKGSGIDLDIVPGRKLCCNCRKKLEAKISDIATSSTNFDS